jgi:membrane-bound lytic murein transglycosylase D
MTYRTMRQRFLLSAGSTVIMSLLLAATEQQAAAMPNASGTATLTSTSSTSPNASTTEHASTASDFASHSLFWEALDATPQDAWTQLRKSFTWDIDTLSPKARARVDKWIAHYRQSPENIVSITREARPWLAWITQQVEERGLPGEIALLPFIESSFDTAARSYRGAAGLWQFMPRTGDALGLVRNGHYDGRLDVTASTRAALDYIEMQAAQWYGGDIALSLAAYNAGAGTVNSARRQAERRGHGGDYWALNLPGETMQYLPKLYAIAQIIDDPERYNVSLPEIHAAPAFAKVTIDRQLSLKNASRLLDVSQSQLARLNPGLLQGTLDPSNASTLLVPGDADLQAIAALSRRTNRTGTQATSTHRVKRGDNLSTIATRYNISQQDLIRWNAIDRPSALQPGQLLSLSGG